MDKTAIAQTRQGRVLLGRPLLSALRPCRKVSVDCDAGNPSRALANVKPGDTVLVSGTCNDGQLRAGNGGITLDGQKKTTIQHPGKGAASPHTVFIRGKDIHIKGITVIGGLDGIHLAGPASAELDGNVVVKAARAGIHIDQGSVARILNITVQESGGYGIDITGVSLAYIGVRIPRIPALSPNTIRNNGGPGINIERSSEAWIVGNTIADNKGSGIVVHRNAHADVIANVINANGGDAITAASTPSSTSKLSRAAMAQPDGAGKTAAWDPVHDSGLSTVLSEAWGKRAQRRFGRLRRSD